MGFKVLVSLERDPLKLRALRVEGGAPGAGRLVCCLLFLLFHAPDAAARHAAAGCAFLANFYLAKQ